MGFEANGREDFGKVALCNVVSQLPVAALNFGVFPFATGLEAACSVLARRAMPVVAQPSR